MKYLISNNSETHLMCLKVYKSTEEAIKAKNKYTNYWKKFNKNNPENKSPRYEAWKKAKIVKIDFSKRFYDVDIVNLQEQKRKTPNRTSVVLKETEQQRITNIVDKNLNKTR